MSIATGTKYSDERLEYRPDIDAQCMARYLGLNLYGYTPDGEHLRCGVDRQPGPTFVLKP